MPLHCLKSHQQKKVCRKNKKHFYNSEDTEICIWFLAAIFIIIAVFLGCFIYVSDYKITKADTSVSLDGIYELVLQAVGETDFPFGAASGRQKFLEL